MGLSKSKYTRYCQCPKMLWMDEHKKQEGKQDPSALSRFAAGNEVGELAKNLFGDYKEATTQNVDGSLDKTQMIKNTQTYIKEGAVNICEAAFAFNGCYCAVDILHKTDAGYEIYEVKSSTGVKKVHYIDAAYQKYIVENCGIKVAGVYIVVINNKYVRRGGLDINQLFKAVNVDADIVPYYNEVAQKTKDAALYTSQENEPNMPVGEYCADPYGCIYFGYCTRHMPKPNVLDIYDYGVKKASGLISENIITYNDVIDKKVALSDKQRRQVETELYDLPLYVDKSALKGFLNELYYPLYFLDFETFDSAIPLFDGMSPYVKEPFQYSLHYIENSGGEVFHKEFLADEMRDPRFDIAKSLADNIPENACILSYNMSFERSRIAYLAGLFPQFKDKLLKIKDNIKDLLKVFNKGMVYNRAMGGSFSLKSVLPALFPDCKDVDYHSLKEVHNGSEATETYLSLRKLSGKAREDTRRNLLEYCKLDTLAMVLILKKVYELSL